MRDFFGKRQLKALIESARRAIDHRRLGHVVDALRSGAPVDRELLRTARRAWGNEAWSADLGYLEEGTTRASRSAAPILECGTGLTTLLACAVAERKGIPVYCLEQDAGWTEVVQDALARYGLSARVSYAPLVPHDDLVWYDISAIELPRKFGLVLCDGPAVLEPWSPEIRAGWRAGVLPVLSKRGIAVDEVLLDDADEPRAARLLERWRADFGCEEVVLGTADGATAVVRPRATSSPA
jgi:hypothetical protein